jgi:hypothetical protein
MIYITVILDGITPDLPGTEQVLDAAATEARVLGVAAHIGAVVPANAHTSDLRTAPPLS